MPTDEVYYAWAAGMFEGEGSIRSRTKQSSYIKKNGERSTNKVTNIELKITSTDLHPLELFNDIFDLKGTIISTDPNLTPSKIERTDTVYKIRYDLIFCNIKTVKEIYANIEMWLSPRRREQCENAISHFEQNISRKGR